MPRTECDGYCVCVRAWRMREREMNWGTVLWIVDVSSKTVLQDIVVTNPCHHTRCMSQNSTLQPPIFPAVN
jgi:hypothetical protein